MPVESLLWVALALVALALVVLVADLRYLLRRDLLRQRYESARDWNGLKAWLLRDRHTWRPLVCLSRARAPGIADADLALRLHQLGLKDEAILRARRAVEAAGDHPRFAPLALRVHVLCAGSLGLAEAEESARRLERFPLQPKLAATLLMHDYQQGRLEAARRRGEALLAADARDGAFLVGLAQTCAMQGELDRAIAIAQKEPGDPLERIPAKERELLSKGPQGRVLLDRLRSRHLAQASAMQRLAAAQAFILFGRGAEAREAFSAVSLGPGTPFALEVIAARIEARAWSLCGEGKKARAALEKHDALLDSQPFLRERFERDLVAGQIELDLGRPFGAEPLLRRALEQARQPIHLHQARHALWKTLSAQRKVAGAATLASVVLADGIPSMLRKQIEASPPLS